ncbi:putative signal peptidase complex subunit 1 [Capsicum annuum]|nr:putative signal peptidase complex subunit 1 [Capsicum annuum]KAF3674606.1 putative signal peptidase complex subunit 1 [Capsicum annuum]
MRDLGILCLQRSLLCFRKQIIYCRSEITEMALKMDWQGQKLVEQLMQILLVSFAVVAFLTGYVLGSFQTMLLTYAGGVVFTALVTIPNWPFFNRNPLNWLDPSLAEKHPKPVSANSGSKKKSTKK